MDSTAEKWQRVINDLPEHLAERTRLFDGTPTGYRNSEPNCDADDSDAGTPPSINKVTGGDEPFVLCWLHHALRRDENPAIDVGILLARRFDIPLLVYQGICEKYQYASDRHHTFMLEGALDLQQDLADAGVSFALHVALPGDRGAHLKTLTKHAAVVVTEDFPLAPTLPWTERLYSTCDTPIILVDTSCIVPMRLVGKAYDRAYAYREATAELYEARLSRPWPTIDAQPKKYGGVLPFVSIDLAGMSIAELVSRCEIDHAVGPVGDTCGGSRAGYSRWNAFIKRGLSSYAKRRNDAAENGVSRLSAYLHYGMVSPFRIAREAAQQGCEKFLEELLIWRELAYAFCFYRENVDTLEAIPAWARRTLEEHRKDPRTAVLSWETTARGKTGNRLWDACQTSLLRHGELHNNVRMTWGKALLEWTRSPEEALRRLTDLNHRYALDGRNPASYGGILWCLGQFDRPFPPGGKILGTVRPRPLAEHAQRLDVSAYSAHISRSQGEASESIAVIGAGLAGLMCARTLQDHGYAVTVFDKGRGVGGRTSSKRGDGGWRCDHGAQYFTVRDRRLAKYVESWLEDGVIAPWDGRIVELQENGEVIEKRQPPRLVGVPGMNAIAKHLAEDLRVQTGIRVVACNPVDGNESESLGSGYVLRDEMGHSHGPFSHVLFNVPAKQCWDITPERCAWKDQLSHVTMTPCWAVMLAFQSRWQLPFDGAFINTGALRWIARDSSKPQRNTGMDTWVLHASAEWTEANLDTSHERVISLLIEAATEITSVVAPPRIESAAHRWMYAQPTRPLPSNCLWDSQLKLGACGDWCNGPRVEGALLSGMALAGRVMGHQHNLTSSTPQEPSQLLMF